MTIGNLKNNEILYDISGNTYKVVKVLQGYSVFLENNGKVNQYYDGFVKSLMSQREYEDYLDRVRQAKLRREQEERHELKEWLRLRKIEKLVHFTDKRNVESIMQHGLLPRKELDARNIEYRYNDKQRLDYQTDAISLSVTSPNWRVLNAFKRDETFNPVFITINADVLYEEMQTERIYCLTNAANADTRWKNGKKLEHFKNMFLSELRYNMLQETRYFNRMGKADNEPTDEQAEILFFGKIDPKYFLEIKDKWR